MSSNASTSAAPADLSTLPSPRQRLAAQLNIDWEVLSFILYSPRDQMTNIIEAADLEPQQKRDALGALAEVLETYAEISINESLYADTMKYLQRFRDTAVENFKQAASTADKADLAAIIRGANYLERTPYGFSWQQGFDGEHRPIDSLIEDVTPCMLCVASAAEATLPHRHIDCRSYKCRRCNQPAPGHIPSLCPFVDRRTRISSDYRPVQHLIQNVPLTNDHLSAMLTVAGDATIKSFAIERSHDRPEHLRSLSPISARIRRVESTRPRARTWVVVDGRVRGIFNDPAVVKRLTKYLDERRVERFDSYTEARARAHELFREPPHYDSVDYIRRVKRLAARTSLVADAAAGIATPELLSTNNSDAPPPSYHTEEERGRSPSRSPPATPIVFRRRRDERSRSPWENNSDHRGHNANRMREQALQPFVYVQREDAGANIAYRITIVETGRVIGRVILIGEEFVIAGSEADPLVHNRGRELSGYDAAEVLLYPLEINSIVYIHDGRANSNVARVVWVGRNGGTLLPIREDTPRERSNHSSDELWAQVETPPLIPGETNSEGEPLI